MRFVLFFLCDRIVNVIFCSMICRNTLIIRVNLSTEVLEQQLSRRNHENI